MYTFIRVHGIVSICGIVWAGKDILESSDFAFKCFLKQFLWVNFCEMT
jgi:hypothetical protein